VIHSKTRFTNFTIINPLHGTVIFHSEPLAREFKLYWFIPDSRTPDVIQLGRLDSPEGEMLHLAGLTWPELHDNRFRIQASALFALGNADDQALADLCQAIIDREEGGE
jgi:hypothetical protein